jgi:predicted RNA-binding protein with TRAM domain
MVNIGSKVKVDDIIEISIDSISRYGKFMGRYNGLIIFVEAYIRAYPGEKIKVKIINVSSNCAHGAVVSGGVPV